MSRAKPAPRFTRSDYAVDPVTLARRLLGQRLVRVLPAGERLSGIIVETEAYLGVKDRAAHSFGGRRTPRVEPMWGPPGHAYVYFTYGMHHCFNVVCGEIGEPVAVLVRALEPEEGVDAMRRLRAPGGRKSAVLSDVSLCSGPAKLCQALGLDRRHSGLDLTGAPELFIERVRARPLPESQIGVGPRVGIDSAQDWRDKPLRFCVLESCHVSVRLARGPAKDR